MPGGGTLRVWKDKLDGYKKYHMIVKTIKMVTLEKYRQTAIRARVSFFCLLLFTFTISYTLCGHWLLSHSINLSNNLPNKAAQAESISKRYAVYLFFCFDELQHMSNTPNTPLGWGSLGT